MKTVTEIVKLAGISKDTYYKAFDKEDFANLYHEQTMKIIRRNVAPMVNAMVKEAVRGSAPHLKMGLEAGDVLKSKVEHDVSERLEDILRRIRGVPTGD